MHQETGHVLIIGKTMYGKTTIARKLAKKLSEKGRPVLVLTPFAQDADWTEFASYVSDDPDSFAETAFMNTGCIIVVDEGGEMASRAEKATAKLATRGRHYGHTCIFIGQCAADVNPTIRRMCSNFFVFKSSDADCRLLDQVIVDSTVYEAVLLEKGECLAFMHGEKPQRWYVFDM